MDTPQHKRPEPSKFHFEENRKSETQSIEEGLLNEMVGKLELLSLELNKLNFINDELIIENELWKEQYEKLQECAKVKEGGNFNMHDVYQENFIKTIGDLESELEQKETKITGVMKNMKVLEKENANLKKELEGKQQLASSPRKKDLVRKVEDLEKMNFHLNNELDQVIYEKKKNISVFGNNILK